MQLTHDKMQSKSIQSKSINVWNQQFVSRPALQAVPVGGLTKVRVISKHRILCHGQ